MTPPVTPAKLHEWANEAEDDLDGRNAKRLRQAAALVAELEMRLDKAYDREARMRAHLDAFYLQAHSIKVLRVLKREQEAQDEAVKRAAWRTLLGMVS